MKKNNRLLFVLFLAMTTLSCSIFAVKSTQEPATTVIDQSSISENDLAAYVNECCKFVAQTFTAGITGTLAGVTIDVKAIPYSPFHLHAAIRTVTTNGVPSPTILGEITLKSGSAPISQFISFPQTIHIIAGDQYAIVVNYEGAPTAGKGQGQGIWLGATDDTYSGGDGYTSISDGISWVQMEGEDLHFQTYVNL